MDMKKMMGKGPEGEDTHKKAKLEVLEELRNMAMGMMGDKMKSHFPSEDEGMEVSVQAEDPESLKEGLEMASEIAPEMPDMADSDDDMDLDEIESMIRELEQKKREKLAKG